MVLLSALIRACSKKGSDPFNLWLVHTLPISLAAKLPDVWARVQSDYTEVVRFRGTLGGWDVVVVSSSRAAAAGE